MMVHCIEAYTSHTKKNPISDALAVKGLQMLWSNFDKVLNHGDDIDARAEMPIDTSGMTDLEAAHQFINQLKDFLKTSGLKYRLNELDITAQDIPALADIVMNTYARLIATNPMDMSLEEVKTIYKEIL